MDRFRLSLIVIGVLAVAILFGGWALGVQPQLDRAGSAAAQTASIRTVNDAQAAKNAQLAADNERLADLQTQLAGEQNHIPSARSQQPLIDELNAAAVSTGTAIESLTFAPAVAYVAPAGVPLILPVTGTLVAVPVTITATGARPNLEGFAAALQSSARIVSIASSQYSGPDDAALTLTGTTWVLKPAS